SHQLKATFFPYTTLFRSRTFLREPSSYISSSLFYTRPNITRCSDCIVPSIFKCAPEISSFLCEPSANSRTSLFNPAPEVSSCFTSYSPTFFKVFREGSSLLREPSTDSFHAFFKCLP